MLSRVIANENPFVGPQGKAQVAIVGAIIGNVYGQIKTLTAAIAVYHVGGSIHALQLYNHLLGNSVPLFRIDLMYLESVNNAPDNFALRQKTVARLW